MIRKEFDELKATGCLPSPSGVGVRILDLMKDEEWSLDDLVETVECDPELTGRVIHLANAADSAPSQSVGSVRNAALRLGGQAVARLALGFTLISGNRSGACARFDFDDYWSDSLARGVAARILSRQVEGVDPGDAFTCALLSRIGELALASVHAKVFGHLLEKCELDGRLDLLQLETAEFGIHHHEVSQAMLEDWGLPRAHSETVGLFALEDGEGRVTEPRARSLIHLVRMVETVSEWLRYGEEGKAALGSRMERLRDDLDLEAEEFLRTCDEIGLAWQEWGQLLNIQTFETLSPPRAVESAAAVLVDGEAGTVASPPLDADPAAHEQASPRRVLVVDDEATARLMLSRFLEKAGYAVETATDGREGLAKVLESPPHIVISDWIMSDMDGIELCKALRRCDAGRNVYFVMVTGQDDDDCIVEAFDAGVDDHIAKPVRPNVLRARVRAGLRIVSLQEQQARDKVRLNEEFVKQAALTRKLREASLTDPLTGLPNRRFVMQRLREEWQIWSREGRSLALMIVDIDHFKSVNDGFGHDVGDIVLQETARVMGDQIRAPDVLARHGGEEFLVLCPGAEEGGARTCAERLRGAVEMNQVRSGDFDRGVTVSIGVAGAEAAMGGADELLKAADSALYEAKSLGRNRVV